MSDPVTRMMFDGLVRRIGGVDAAAAVLEARYGTGHKGTVSKMAQGHIGVTLDAVVALEDALGAFPMTERMAARSVAERDAAGNLRDLAAQSSIFSGNALSAVIRAMSDGSTGGQAVTPCEAADIIAQMQPLLTTVNAVIAAAERIISGGKSV